MHKYPNCFLHKMRELDFISCTVLLIYYQNMFLLTDNTIYGGHQLSRGPNSAILSQRPSEDVGFWRQVKTVEGNQLLFPFVSRLEQFCAHRFTGKHTVLAIVVVDSLLPLTCASTIFGYPGVIPLATSTPGTIR